MKLALLLAFAACAATQTPAPPPANRAPPASNDEVMVTLERGECYGFCPIYKLAIHRDGRVEYRGYRFVKLEGAASRHLDPSQLDALDRAFERADYFSLADHYDHENITDQPSATTSYRRSGRTKTVSHDQGDREAPDALSTLEDEIDRIVRVEQWIGTEDERFKLREQWMKEIEAEAGSSSAP